MSSVSSGVMRASCDDYTSPTWASMSSRTQKLHPAHVFMPVWSLITMSMFTEQLCTDTMVLSLCTSSEPCVYVL